MLRGEGNKDWGNREMIDIAKHLNIFVGPSGSGKTEIALNWAWQLADKFSVVALVDLDILNPYFTSRQLGQPLENKGIEVVAAPREWANTDLPVISPRVKGLLQDPGYRVVCDVGGDDLGAVALGQFAAEIKTREHHLFFVVNPFRPLTGVAGGIATLVKEVEAAAGLKVTALVSNPNLGEETRGTVIKEGHRIVQEAASVLKLPIAFLALRSDLAGEVGAFSSVPPFPLEIFIKKPWERGLNLSPAGMYLPTLNH